MPKSKRVKTNVVIVVGEENRLLDEKVRNLLADILKDRKFSVFLVNTLTAEYKTAENIGELVFRNKNTEIHCVLNETLNTKNLAESINPLIEVAKAVTFEFDL